MALGCLLGKVFGGFGGFWGVLVWKVFAGWQTAALKANRKPLLWPWPWGAWLRSGLGPGVPVGEGVWRVLEGLEGFGLEGFRGFWRGRVLVWKVLEGLEGLEGFGRCLEGLEGFGGFGGFGGFWRVFGGFGGFWSVWRVLEGLECLRAGKRQL